ncbi:M16 family metallopeptidase [Desulfovibrio inopinatus]|uniref:M16 family metallopeptidase n=1 Tax=Desulfovibrio inopinatus TaxID=102109 RepID=UPI0004278B18|nr:pitrilysin family protein [Desulfovibrio inopinatus]
MTDPSSACFTRLDNGVAVATERLPHVRSSCLGIWVMSGSRHEQADQEGMAHFWEHLSFKGTTSLSALDIAKRLDLMGGLANAFTTRENTCYYTRVVDKHLPDAFEVLSDIVQNPDPTDDDIASERDVVLQEIRMVEETPDDVVHELFWEALWDNRKAGHAILGSSKSVSSFTRETLQQHRQMMHTPSRILVCATGQIDHEAIVTMSDQVFGGMTASPAPASEPVPGMNTVFLPVQRKVEQNHLIMAFPSYGSTDNRRFTHSLLSAILGGTMSSRLFQEVREKRGLAYTITSFVDNLRDCGVFQIYAAVDPGKTLQVAGLVRDEIDRIASGDVTEDELIHAREHLLGLLFLSTESTEERMMRLARNRILFNTYISYAETAAHLEHVSLEDIRQAAAAFTVDNASLCVLGPRIDDKLANFTTGGTP